MEVYYGVVLSAEKYYNILAKNFWAENVKDPLRDFIYAIHEDKDIKLNIHDTIQIDKDPIKFLIRNPYKLQIIPYYQYLKYIPLNAGYSILLGYELDIKDYELLPIEDVLTPEIKAKVDQELKFNEIVALPDIYMFKIVGKERLRFIG